MLDRQSLHVLAQRPEQNDPILNVALAEEGDIVVLRALAECTAVGPEALSRIGERIAAEGETVGETEDPESDDDRPRSRHGQDGAALPSNAWELDRRLLLHPRSGPELRDAILARHEDDTFFVLAAAAHPYATERALARVAGWPSATPLHDRTWLALVDPRAVPPLVAATWASEEDELYREAAARLSLHRETLEALSRDASRRVRRAVAGNPNLPSAVLSELQRDPACEVRARALSAPLRPNDGQADSPAADITSARFKAAASSMRTGGIVASDVARALRSEPLDAEGARWAARALDDSSVIGLLSCLRQGEEVELGVAAGIALRDMQKSEDKGIGLLAQCVHALANADRSGGLLTGKGRLAEWLFKGIARLSDESSRELVDALGEKTLAADRMVLGRAFGNDARVAHMCALALRGTASLPVALLELAWKTTTIDDRTIERIAARIAPNLDGGSLECDVDLDPRERPLEVLERVGVTLVGKAPLSPRAALALVAIEPRRVRYILSALPQWKGVLSGANVARVLKAHAGALSAAGPSAQKKPSQESASWTQRKLDEVELAVALSIRDISPGETLKRIATGYAPLTQGPALASGIEARATLEGTKAVECIVEFLARERSRDAAVLAAWLLVEGLDRPRSPAAIAAALDAPWGAAHSPGGARSMVPAGLSEALATLERRHPGRLAAAAPQTPRGRAALASGIARAYRALGGMTTAEP
jgi:hypothetical protein